MCFKAFQQIEIHIVYMPMLLGIGLQVPGDLLYLSMCTNPLIPALWSSKLLRQSRILFLSTSDSLFPRKNSLFPFEKSKATTFCHRNDPRWTLPWLFSRPTFSKWPTHHTRSFDPTFFRITPDYGASLEIFVYIFPFQSGNFVPLHILMGVNKHKRWFFCVLVSKGKWTAAECWKKN